MADPKRLVVLKRLTEYLESEVSTSNGYQHNLAGAVFRGRYFFSKDDPVPMVSILENPDPDRFPQAAGRNGTQVQQGHEAWTLLIQGWAVDDKINPTDPAYRLMADVTKALSRLSDGGDPANLRSAPLHYLLGGANGAEPVVTYVRPEPGVVRPPTEQQTELAFFWIRCEFGFVEDPADPYNLD